MVVAKIQASKLRNGQIRRAEAMTKVEVAIAQGATGDIGGC